MVEHNLTVLNLPLQRLLFKKNDLKCESNYSLHPASILATMRKAISYLYAYIVISSSHAHTHLNLPLKAGSCLINDSHEKALNWSDHREDCKGKLMCIKWLLRLDFSVGHAVMRVANWSGFWWWKRKKSIWIGGG